MAYVSFGHSPFAKISEPVILPLSSKKPFVAIIRIVTYLKPDPKLEFLQIATGYLHPTNRDEWGKITLKQDKTYKHIEIPIAKIGKNKETALELFVKSIHKAIEVRKEKGLKKLNLSWEIKNGSVVFEPGKQKAKEKDKKSQKKSQDK